MRERRKVTKDTLAKPLHFFDAGEAMQHTTRQKEGARFVADSEFRGENEPYGALLTYSLNVPGLPHPIEEKERERKAKEREAAQKEPFPATGVPPDVPKEPVKAAPSDAAAAKKPDDGKEPQVDIEVSDASGKVIRKFKGPAKLGVNRTAWDFTRDAFKLPKSEEPEQESFRPRTGPEVPPGTYTVTIKFRGNEAKQPVNVTPDPRTTLSADARQAKYNAILRAGALQEKTTEAIERIRKTRADIDAVAAKLKKDDDTAETDALVKTGNDLKKKLDAMERRLWTPPRTKGIVAETDALSKVQYPLQSLQSSWDAPTPAQLAYLTYAEGALREVLADYNKLYAEDLAKYRDEVRKQNLVLVPDTTPIEP